MTSHDRLCPVLGMSWWTAWWHAAGCECDLIRAVRADQSDRVAAAIGELRDIAADAGRPGPVLAAFDQAAKAALHWALR